MTDAVGYYNTRGELRGAVRAVRTRRPERFRWRAAVGAVAASARPFAGLERARVEEPIREVVLDLSDRELRRDVVLDARRHGLDLDRGEILPHRTLLDLHRLSFLAGTSLELLGRLVTLPGEVDVPVETGGIAVVARAIGERYRRKARELTLGGRLRGPAGLSPADLELKERAARLDALGERWTAFGRAVATPDPA